MIPTPYLGMLRKAGIQAAETHDYIISATTCSDRTVSAIVDRLEAEYEVERARLQADVDAFVGTLAEKGLLQGDGQG